jgi:hypothetical protein
MLHRRDLRGSMFPSIMGRDPSERRYLATDGKVGRSQENIVARDFAEMKPRGNAADLGKDGSVARAIPDRRTGYWGLFRDCAEGS